MGDGGGGMGVTNKGYGFSFCGDENVLKVPVMMVAHVCEYTGNH